jgi:hypothetical protein
VGVRPSADKVPPLRSSTRDIKIAQVAGWDLDGNGNFVIDASGFLSAGDIFVIKFVGNYLGELVQGPTVYSGGNLTLPMALREMANPIGSNTKLTDSTEFKAFRVEKQ